LSRLSDNRLAVGSLSSKRLFLEVRLQRQRKSSQTPKHPELAQERYLGIRNKGYFCCFGFWRLFRSQIGSSNRFKSAFHFLEFSSIHLPHLFPIVSLNKNAKTIFDVLYSLVSFVINFYLFTVIAFLLMRSYKLIRCLRLLSL